MWNYLYKKEQIPVDNLTFIRLLICIIICRLCSYIYFTVNLAVLFIKCKKIEEMNCFVSLSNIWTQATFVMCERAGKQIGRKLLALH